MNDIVIQIFIALVSLVIFYVIIRSATGTDKKLEILKSIDKSNKSIELLLESMTHLKTGLQINSNDPASVDYLVTAKKIAEGLMRNTVIDKDKSVKLGSLRKLYIKQSLERGQSESEANETYNNLISDLQDKLSPINKEAFVVAYNKGINSN